MPAPVRSSPGTVRTGPRCGGARLRRGTGTLRTSSPTIAHRRGWGRSPSTPTLPRTLPAVPPPHEAVAWHRRRKVWGAVAPVPQNLAHFRKVQAHHFLPAAGSIRERQITIW